MTETIQTQRLTLRPLTPADAGPVAEALSEFDVVRALPRLPWPYGARDAEAFIAHATAREPATYAIEAEGAFCGVVCVNDHLGYWLHKRAWGRGFASEAARAVLARYFHYGAEQVPSGHLEGNSRSRRVLKKLGFRDRGTRAVFCKAENREMTMQDMMLSRAAWEAAQ